MDGDSCHLSLILPAYNEAAGIAQAVREADDALRRLVETYEIIVVDDGSSDGTAEAVLAAAQDLPRIRLVRHDVNRGYGAALRTGFAAARGERIAFTDADAQFDLADLALLLPLTETHPIAAGYRIDRQDTWLRKLYSRGYNLLARTLLGIRVRDIDCALKVFRREALARLMPETNGFFVNTEILTRAAQLNLPIAEAGVRHRPRLRGASKVSLRDVPRVLKAMLPFWWSRMMFAGRPARDDDIDAPLRVILCALLLAMSMALFFSRLGQPLLEPEEARYAEVPRQMLAEGRLLTPVLHGEAYYQKPPLLYWLTMASYRCLGVHDWSARLIPALAGVATIAVTTLWGWRCLGFWTGLLAGTMLCLSGRFVYLASMLTMDGLLCLWVISALAAGHVALIEARRSLPWSLIAAGCCGLGVLTKGPVALVLVVAPLALLAFLEKRRLRWLILLGAALGVAAPWYAAILLRDTQAALDFFWTHNIVRYVAPLDHEEPVWYYVPSLLLGALPWTLLLVPLVPYLLRRSATAGRRRPEALGCFLLALACCVGFFSCSGCKRPGYILPAFPLLALVLATYITHGLPWLHWLDTARAAHRVQRLGHRLALRMLVCICVLGAGAGIGLVALGHWTWPQAATLSAGMAIFLGVATQLQAGAIAAASWGGTAAALFVLLLLGMRDGLPRYHARYVLRPQVQEQIELANRGPMPIICYPKRWDSIGFYLGRRDVEAYGPTQKQALLEQLKEQGEALMFVRRAGALADLLHTLPEGWEFLPRGTPGKNVVTGIVRTK